MLLTLPRPSYPLISIDSSLGHCSPRFKTDARRGRLQTYNGYSIPNATAAVVHTKQSEPRASGFCFTMRQCQPPREKFPSDRHYHWITRILHWFLARMGLFQTVFLFMWLAERAQHNRDPPFPPWAVYTYAATTFLSSTGLSARFLSRFSLSALSATHLCMACMYLFGKQLVYARWLRLRIALRTIGCAAVYLRMLGTTRDPVEAAHSVAHFTGAYALGVTLMATFTMLSGLLCLPARLISLDREAQLVEQDAIWPVFTAFKLFVDLSLTVCFLVASMFHVFPWLTGWKRTAAVQPLLARCIRLGDRFTLLALAGLVLFHDTNVDYWVRNGSEFWIHCQVLLNSCIIIAGIFVTADLHSSFEHSHKSL